MWGSCKSAQSYRIQKVINHCERIVKGARLYDHATPLLVELVWPKFEYLLDQRDLAAIRHILYCALYDGPVQETLTRREGALS